MESVGLPVWVTELDYDSADRYMRAQGYEDALRLYFRWVTRLDYDSVNHECEMNMVDLDCIYLCEQLILCGIYGQKC